MVLLLPLLLKFTKNTSIIYSISHLNYVHYYEKVKYGWTLEKTMEFITSRRMDVNPIESFKKQLQKLSEGVGLDKQRAQQMKKFGLDVRRKSLWDPAYLGTRSSIYIL